MTRRGNETTKKLDDKADNNWTPASNSAVRDLLDHLAKELADEYIRLMKKTVPADSDSKDFPKEED